MEVARMDVQEREIGDGPRLIQRSRRERDAEQRDRLRAVALALQGFRTSDIQSKLDRSRAFVQRWVYAYRDGGIDAIARTPHPGGDPRLPRVREAELKSRLEAGPLEADGVCTLRGLDIQRILEEEFGVCYSLNGVYQLLHRLNYSCLKPRPRHEKNDPQAMAAFRERAPLLSGP
jgi:transposase